MKRLVRHLVLVEGAVVVRARCEHEGLDCLSLGLDRVRLASHRHLQNTPPHVEHCGEEAASSHGQ